MYRELETVNKEKFVLQHGLKICKDCAYNTAGLNASACFHNTPEKMCVFLLKHGIRRFDLRSIFY